MTNTTPKPLVCDSCAAAGPEVHAYYSPSATGQQLISEHLCPDCVKRMALSRAADYDLYAVLWPAVQAWAKRWQAAGLSQSALEGSLEMLGTYWHYDGALKREGTYQAITDALAGRP